MLRTLVKRAWLGVSVSAIFGFAGLVGCGSAPETTSDAGDGGSNGGGDDGGGISLGDGGGISLGDGGTIGRRTDGGDGGCGPNLTGVLRDFSDTHPDFEKFLGDDRGVVAVDLGADSKPVYASASTTATTTGKANFDQWYRDVDGVNIEELYKLTFTPGANGISTFHSEAFFPLDDKGFGNQGRAHNFHFTFELHTEFVYKGGEVFTFVGDDDVWVFINGKLAIDIGGVHSAQTQSVDLDAKAGELGLQKGATHTLAIFQAERHTSESNFRVDTSIEFTNCDPIIIY